MHIEFFNNFFAQIEQSIRFCSLSLISFPVIFKKIIFFISIYYNIFVIFVNLAELSKIVSGKSSHHIY